MAHPAPHLKAQAEGRRLFIGGLNYETTDQSLQAYLSTRLDSLLSVFLASKPIFCLFRWPIEEVRVKRFPDGNSRGFGWVCYILDVVENWLYLTFVSRFATFNSVSTLENCFNSGPHWVDGKQVQYHSAELTILGFFFIKPLVGWDEKGWGGWWSCQWKHWRN